ncbi:MAG: GHKL domain-containing protein [Marinospirillum sp.]|nr:GHKL domain-containing protein [Marinospirillum sp.]
MDPATGQFVDCNAAGLKLLKLNNTTQIIGRKPEDISPEYQPDGSVSSKARKTHFEALKETESLSFEWIHLASDGFELLLQVTLIPVEIRGRSLILGVWYDLTERQRSELAVQQKTESLQKSNAELEQFAYVVSHDLRQPLRMIGSYLQLLERRLETTLTDETREMMHFAVDGASRLDQMLVSLLEYSRVGRKGLPMTDTPAETAIQEALQFLQPLIDEKQARVQLLTKSWPMLHASPDELTRLFQNLIGNALKYHQPGQAPQVSLDVERTKGHWRFCIRDQGIGIAPEQFDRLFRVFQRLHTRSEYEGTGIGLAVCRKIVERHGGRIWVESEGEGKGCSFCFVLPFADSREA